MGPEGGPGVTKPPLPSLALGSKIVLTAPGAVVTALGENGTLSMTLPPRITCAPGVATLTEAYAALAAGADALKLFPAEALSPAVLKAWRAVLRPPVALVPVGGIVPASVAAYAASGASGFGLGSALYRSGDSAADVARQAAAFMQAWNSSYNTSL